MKKVKLFASLKNFFFVIAVTLIISFIPENGGPLAFLKSLLQITAFLSLFISLALLLMRLVTYPLESEKTPVQSSTLSGSNPINITPAAYVETSFLAQFGLIFSVIFTFFFVLVIWILFQLWG